MPFRELPTHEDFLRTISREACVIIRLTRRNLDTTGLARVADAVAERLEGRIKFFDVMTEETPEPMHQFRPRYIPCLIFFKDGNEIFQISRGTEEELTFIIKGYFGIEA